MRPFAKIKNDPGGYLLNQLDYIWILLKMRLNSIAVRLVLSFRGISYGKGCDFYSWPHFRRHFLSKIEIGNDCRFRSDYLSNLVGINRKCLVSTMNEGAKIKIGKNSGFSGTVIGCAESIHIGDNVLCGGNTFITDFDWHPVNRRGSEHIVAETAPVVIEDNVWLGLNVVVLKGVTIGQNSVIGANSLVVRSIPANVVAAGNPCRVLRKLNEDKLK
jgi:acetyltransferase-like isoleucine patch superfamily enzyme